MPIKVPIEDRGSFRLQSPFRFRPPVNDPVRGGAIILLAFLDVFADLPQVDDLAHSLSHRPTLPDGALTQRLRYPHHLRPVR